MEEKVEEMGEKVAEKVVKEGWTQASDIVCTTRAVITYEVAGEEYEIEGDIVPVMPQLGVMMIRTDAGKVVQIAHSAIVTTEYTEIPESMLIKPSLSLRLLALSKEQFLELVENGLVPTDPEGNLYG